MKMLNKVEASKTPRWDMMQVVKKMQIDLDRMHNGLQSYGTRTEVDAIKGAVSNLNFLLMKLNNNRGDEL